MDEHKRLHNSNKTNNNCPTKTRLKGAALLGESLNKLMENRILPQHTKYGSVVEVWEQLLPAELSRHCRLSGVWGGQLEVQVDSPSYMHELRLCSLELLERLQQQCPKARIKEIKFVIGDL